MDKHKYSAVPPPPSLSSSNHSPANFNDALSKAKAIAQKLKPKNGETIEDTTHHIKQSNPGTKRTHEEYRDDYHTSSGMPYHNAGPHVHDNKRSAYDTGTSRPYYVNEPQKYGLGSEQRKPSYNNTNYGSRQYQEDYSVPNHMVGLLIGKGGENLKKIERMSGVSKVQFDNDPIGNERVVHIIGEPDQIAIARDMIRQMVSDAQVNDISRFPTGSDQTHQVTLNIRVPTNKVGLVIGRGGETIRNFQERTKAKIMIASDSYGDKNGERVLTLVGDETSTQQAKKLIEDLVYGSSNPPPYNYSTTTYEAQPAYGTSTYNFYGYGSMPRPDDDNALIPVPVYAVGLIIGKGGETIKHIQDKSGARVKIDPTSDPNAEHRVVNIAGDPSCVAIARQLVEEKLVEANPSVDLGYTGYTPAANQQYYNTDYSQYNQYYAQYGYNPQYFNGQGSEAGYQQYQAYPYGYQGGSNENIPVPVSKSTGSPNKGNENNKTKADNTNTNQSNNSDQFNYYNQYYGGQQGDTEDQAAYYQWYQQYYGQQQYEGYTQQGNNQEPNEEKNGSTPSKDNATTESHSNANTDKIADKKDTDLQIEDKNKNVSNKLHEKNTSPLNSEIVDNNFKHDEPKKEE